MRCLLVLAALLSLSRQLQLVAGFEVMQNVPAVSEVLLANPRRQHVRHRREHGQIDVQAFLAFRKL